MKKLFILTVMLAVTFVHGQMLYSYGFDGTNATMASDGWIQTNQSTPVGSGTWLIPDIQNFLYWDGGYEGGTLSFAYVNFNSAGIDYTPATLSNWLITPAITVQNGDIVSFYSCKGGFDINPVYQDNMQFRMSPTENTVYPFGSAEDVGSFSTLGVEINPDLTHGGYPYAWTQYTYTVSGLSGLTDCKFAFRYYIPDGGPFGVNSDTIAIDSFSVERPLNTESFFKSNLSISPNPANNLININANAILINNVEITDINGRVVKKVEAINSHFSQISISDLSSDLYFVKVNTDQGVGTTKLIKQ